ncbi:zf-HC2 domain-containing protein [Janthinobacterium agaricidamnosum]|uniref:zf-HC2 domain-containing protein n=1 Tax=Janthinobacterium agaricidamnosum TaxID=55508 RepID=UPI00068C0EFF|nr:zf-HC2 domain-containing protein [Janthinobacterium agaricidamnosum]
MEFEASTHQKVQKLLPWMLEESLTGAELSMVRKHLLHCEECRADLAWQRQIQAARPPMQSAPDVDRAFAALSGRLEPVARARRPRHAVSEWLRNAGQNLWQGGNGGAQWQRWAMATQCAVIAGLALALLKPASDVPQQYHALSAAGSPATAAAAASGNVMVLFKPDTTERELRRILQASGAHIVNGPTVTDAYLLYLPPAGLHAALLALRREPAVTLVAPLDSGAAR